MAQPHVHHIEEQQTALWRKWIGGVGFTFLIAALGYLLAMVPGFSLAGPLASAIVLSVGYRQVFGYPETYRPGIEFSSKRLLRFAIILYGLKLNVGTVLSDGLGLLLLDAAVVAFAILFTMWLARVMKADSSISMLVGIGTGVCGAAAIAATAPILKTKEEDTAIGVGIIALMGTFFAIVYTLLRPVLPMDDLAYGSWVGVSIHEVAQVALAAAPAGEEPLAMALLAKLGRVFLLIPLCFILIFIMKRKNKGQDAEGANVTFPWFLVGFIVMSILGTYVFGPVIPIAETTMNTVDVMTTFLLTAAMVGLGLKVDLKQLKEKAWKPLIAMTVTSVFLSALTFLVLM
ncbi:YeiH family protein [Salimicrobium halophilum]|uniref:Conserved hypothetical integral membrane protein n=1 Tax=Salimicrobium halophilum TaxID=86666 RepID=A0A1G8QV84_9BACI|nr:putative sulfate exporter family transporter [Salimicrobium halophilum]SDJ08581.1 conserved hypothetical integral membrane protein [Salimicrobium halophilum]